MIKYSRRAAKALAFLFRPYNDIDVYVEDTLSRNMYEILFERMLDGRARIEKVFQLDGKNEVIEACRLDQVDTTRRRIYFIDGDYDLLTGSDAPRLNYLYRLNVYSSENLVLTKTAVLEVSYESSTNESKEDVKNRIDYEAFINRIVEALLPLFILNAALHKVAAERSVQVHVRTTKYPVFNLCEQIGRIPCIAPPKVEQRINEVIEELVRDYGYDRAEFQAIVSEIQAQLPSSTVELIKYISAKTHILPLLYHQMRDKVGFAGSLEQLKVRLARYCERDVDPGLFEAITATSRGMLLEHA